MGEEERREWMLTFLHKTPLCFGSDTTRLSPCRETAF